MIKKFNIEEIGLTNKKRSSNNNFNIYADWAKETLKEVLGRGLEEGEKFNAEAFNMNDKNANYLYEMFDSPFAYLYISPMINNDLADDEFEIVEDRILEKRG